MTIKEVSIAECKLVLPTYREPAAEEMPMFAENRVHQRTSGNPYPNKVVLEVDREHREEKEYTCIRIENDYIRVEILPELGGRIYSAFDKTTGYDFFYKQHVIKPALIGCLGSWISGGVEFNWPFHHRASTFMPTDYEIERTEDGGVIVWLSEHDPIHRMKGMVGVVLKPESAYFETRVKLCNRTPFANSFLWWENAAVAVNKDYRIFFPKDVSYVNFHYKRSVTTYPTATNDLGIFNGIRRNGEVDISYHKSTVQPTSYFCAPSKYDFFGGFDSGRGCGTVHIADHHISPGKKMFTWAYNELSESWEKALTDTDGAYAELMAGCYSDNQPDFAWLAPYETKVFSQFWYPIGNVGIPFFANTHGAISDKDGLTVQLTSAGNAEISIRSKDGKLIFNTNADFVPGIPQSFEAPSLCVGDTVSVVSGGKCIMSYTEFEKDLYGIPETTKDLPYFKEVKTAEELYLEGVHVMQYRDPASSPLAYWEEALRREPDHADTLIALPDYHLRRCEFSRAYDYIKRAESKLCRFNARPQSGKLFYTKALCELALDMYGDAYDSFYRAAWNMDYKSAAMTHTAALDGRNGDYPAMLRHSEEALRLNADNGKTGVFRAVALVHLGITDKAAECLNGILKKDPLFHLAEYVRAAVSGEDTSGFYARLHSNPSETCLDLYFDLISCGETVWAKELLSGLGDGVKTKMVYFALGDTENGERAEVGSAFPSRIGEYKILTNLTKVGGASLPSANYLLGCMEYNFGQYMNAKAHFEAAISQDTSMYAAYRNLAALCYSHLGEKERVLPLLKKALELKPFDRQLVYEAAVVSGKLGVSPSERIRFIKDNTEGILRDDICLELARAYNQNGEYDCALKLLGGHAFVPCEGGEHAVAEEYMFAHFAKGRAFMSDGKYIEAVAEYEAAQVLPKNLGAGLWNECRLVPHKFYLALCLEKMGHSDKAHEIYEYITSLTIDYFSNMHLPELPYYMAVSFVKLGRFYAGRAVIDKHLKAWSAAIGKEDPGYFGTTPFFISYCDDAKTARCAYFSYLLGFAYRFMEKEDESHRCFAAAHECDPSNLNYGLESTM